MKYTFKKIEYVPYVNETNTCCYTSNIKGWYFVKSMRVRGIIYMFAVTGVFFGNPAGGGTCPVYKARNYTFAKYKFSFAD